MSLSMKEQMENLSAEEKATRLKSFKERMGDIPFATRGLDDYKIYGYIEVYEAAVRNGAKFPDVIATQWALESGWGEKQSGDNNYFGIKARDGEKYKLVDTLENLDGKGNKPTKEKFRSYDSLDEAIQDRISRPHWKRAEERSETAEDYINYLTFISNYATDDEYDVKMKQTLNSRHKYGLEYGERGNGAISKANRKAAYMERLAAIDNNKSSADTINEGYGQLAGNLNTAANSLPDFITGKQDMVAKAEEFTTTAEQFDTSTRKDVATPRMLSSMNPNLPNSVNYSEFDKNKIFNTVNPDSELAQMDDQTKKLNNEREVAFNFTGSPTLNAKTLLAPKKQSKFGGKMFKDGGALTEFNEGGTHEENPLGGIPQGQGNLVEEGETKYNDYIFSNSLYLSKEDVKEARLDPKLAGKTIAEASKYINRFLDEAPYDKITRDTVNDQLDQLMLINERMLTAHQAEEEALMANDPAVQEGMALQEEIQAMEQMQGMEGQDPMSQGGMPSPEEMMLQEQPGMFNFGGGLNFNTDLTSRSPFIDYDGQAYGNGQGSMRVPSGIMEPTTIGSDLANNTNAAVKSAKLQQGVSKGLAAGAGAIGVIDNFTGDNLSGNALQDGIGSTMSGASAGMAFGPVGAAIGGGLGLVSGLVGSNSKKKKLERAKNNAISNEFNSGFVGEKLTFAKGGDLKKSTGKSLYQLKKLVEENATPQYADSLYNMQYQNNVNKASGMNVNNNSALTTMSNVASNSNNAHVQGLWDSNKEAVNNSLAFNNYATDLLSRASSGLVNQSLAMTGQLPGYEGKDPNKEKRELERLRSNFKNVLANMEPFDLTAENLGTVLDEILIDSSLVGEDLQALRDNFNNKILPNIGKGDDTTNLGTVMDEIFIDILTLQKEREEALKPLRDNYYNNIVPKVEENRKRDENPLAYNFEKNILPGVLEKAKAENDAKMAKAVEENKSEVKQDTTLTNNTTEKPTIVNTDTELTGQKLSDITDTGSTNVSTTVDNEVLSNKQYNFNDPFNSTQGNEFIQKYGNKRNNSTFTPRNNFGVNTINAAPVVGSFFDMVNKEKADPVSYQTSSFKYDPTFMDESVLQNNIRQASANTLRSLEQSGMSAGQMAAAKLATGATEMQGMNDAYMNVNQHNAAERSKMQDVDMRRNDFNISMTNKQIEDNLAGQAAATAQNRADRTNFYNNISQLGKQLGDENKAYNLTRGYTADGRYRPENMFKDYLNVFKGKPVERKAGGNLNSIFEDSKANSVALMNLLIQNMTNNGK